MDGCLDGNLHYRCRWSSSFSALILFFFYSFTSLLWPLHVPLFFSFCLFYFSSSFYFPFLHAIAVFLSSAFFLASLFFFISICISLCVCVCVSSLSAPHMPLISFQLSVCQGGKQALIILSHCICVSVSCLT